MHPPSLWVSTYPPYLIFFFLGPRARSLFGHWSIFTAGFFSDSLIFLVWTSFWTVFQKCAILNFSPVCVPQSALPQGVISGAIFFTPLFMEAHLCARQRCSFRPRGRGGGRLFKTDLSIRLQKCCVCGFLFALFEALNFKPLNAGFVRSSELTLTLTRGEGRERVIVSFFPVRIDIHACGAFDRLGIFSRGKISVCLDLLDRGSEKDTGLFPPFPFLPLCPVPRSGRRHGGLQWSWDVDRGTGAHRLPTPP